MKFDCALLTALLAMSCIWSFAFVSSSQAPSTPGAATEDSNTIEGTWLPSTAELGGKMFPDEVRKTIKLVVKDDKYMMTAGENVDQGTVKLNPAAKPRELDITGTEGPNKGRTILVTYQREKP